MVFITTFVMYERKVNVFSLVFIVYGLCLRHVRLQVYEYQRVDNLYV